MLTYTYRCDACGLLFEVRQRMSEEPIPECPRGGGPVKRVITGGRGALVVAHNSTAACSAGGG